MSVVEVSVDYGGRQLTLQTGKLAKQTDASVLCRYGETVVLVTVVASHDVKENQDFFPLTVDFLEKYYAAGRVPGGFFKREAKPSDRATLSARMIDRPIRPLFPEDFLCETNVVATVLSIDGVNEAEIAASIAASAALHISDIPWAGPVGACRVGLINGEFVINPPPADQPNSDCDLMVAGVRTGLIMVEGSAKELSEKQMNDALEFGHNAMKAVLDLQEELRQKAGREKREYPKPVRNEALKAEMKKMAWPLFENGFSIREKLARYDALKGVKDALKAKFSVAEPKTKEDTAKNALVSTYFEELKSQYARELTLNTKRRIDGRPYNEIRPITCDLDLLPRVHGSALFTRGETQVLATVTLGTSDDEQKIDAISGAYQKTFLLHYNFPPYSVGEARPMRPPGRREIGHGFLAERALSFVLPPREGFPYTVRLVSEVLESNGSSSMATVCSGSMAMMAAGIPIPKAVAGVAMGLIKEGDKYAVLSDILGDEDHLGDMDFKVCGTAEGITAFQMDLKIGGVSREIMEEALEQAREGRLHVLAKMNETISEPRAEFSPYAPRIFTIKVKPDKVREVIGSGGKVIRSIIERTGVKIDIEDDGTVNIASADNESAQKAIEIINQIVEEPEVGRIYEGRVTRIAEFGAFVEIIPGTDGLCHISELDNYRVRRVEDVVKEGDIIKVKCLDVDSQGKIRLSRKALLPKDGEGARAEAGEEPRAGRPERSERPEREGRERPEREGRPERGDRLERAERDRADRDHGERGMRGERDRGERSDRGERDRGDRDRGERAERGRGDRDRGDRERGLRSERGDRDRGDRDRGERDRGDRDRGERGDRDRGDRERGDRDRGDRERGPRGDRGDFRSHRGGEERGSRGEERGSRLDRGDDRGNRTDRGDDRGNRLERGDDRGNRRGSEDRGNRRERGERGGGGGRGRGPSDERFGRDRDEYSRDRFDRDEGPLFDEEN